MVTTLFNSKVYHGFFGLWLLSLKRFALLTAFAIPSGMLVGCSKQADFELSSIVLREMAPGREMGVGYLNISNLSDKNLTLNYVHSPRADRIEVHQHLYENGKMQMREIKHLSVDPRNQLSFSPGGHHLMLFGVYERFEQGQEVELTFEFENHPPLTVMASVKRM